MKNYSDRLNTSLGWDLFAYGKQMGFTIVSNPAKADVIVGNRSLTDAEINLVKEGKPYVGYTANALKAAKAMGIGVEYVDGGGYDALTTVTYESDSLITAKYKKKKTLSCTDTAATTLPAFQRAPKFWSRPRPIIRLKASCLLHISKSTRIRYRPSTMRRMA